MAQEHWFDVLSKTALRSITRRETARSVAALLPGVLLGGLATSTVGKRKKGSKGKGQGNGKKHKPKRPDHLGDPDPDVDDCDAFLDDPGEQENCKRDRERCRAPNQFCIHAIDSDGDDDIRGYSCCTGGKECCITGCKDTSSDPEYCGAGCGGRCAEGEQCVNGECQEACPPSAARSARRSDNGECQEACPPGLARCAGSNDCTLASLPCCGRWRCANPNATCCPGLGGELGCWWPNTPCDG